MANPVKIQTVTTPDSLKVMSDAETDYIAHVILADFASADTGVGTVSLNPTPITGLTIIGTHRDTSWTVGATTKLTNYQDSFQAFFGGFSPGSFGSGAGSFSAEFYGAARYTASDQLNQPSIIGEFYQDRQTASETLTVPVEYDGVTGRIIEQTSSNLNASVILRALNRYAAFGLGSYKLATAAPLSGGTWTSKGTMTDTFFGGSQVETLWRRTSQTAPTVIRPLKTRLLGNEYNVIEMTDVDIETLTDRFRNRIAATGIGTYQLQESAPVGGTWITAGDETSDTRRQAFHGTFGTYHGTYIGASFVNVTTNTLWLRTA